MLSSFFMKSVGGQNLNNEMTDICGSKIDFLATSFLFEIRTILLIGIYGVCVVSLDLKLQLHNVKKFQNQIWSSKYLFKKVTELHSILKDCEQHPFQIHFCLDIQFLNGFQHPRTKLVILTMGYNFEFFLPPFLLCLSLQSKV